MILCFFAGIFGGFFGNKISQQPVEMESGFVTGETISSIASRTSGSVFAIVENRDAGDIYNDFFDVSSGTSSESGLNNLDFVIGTGFFVAPSGVAVTNKHLVSNSDSSYFAMFKDGATLPINIIKLSDNSDIALIRVIGDFPTTPFIKLADSDFANIGDAVLAIGNISGKYMNSVTVGVISNLNQTVVTSGYANFPSEKLTNLILADTTVNSGNSGGPLLNFSGDAVGMITAVDTSANGLAFAITSKDIKVMLEEE